MLPNLKTLTERLTGPTPRFENLQRQVFNNFIRKGIKTKSRGLSVSCGDGIWDYFALTCGIESIHATDIVANPVPDSEQKILRENGSWSFSRVVKDEKLPYEDNYFDISFSQDVIEHTVKPNFFIAEQFRVLKPGGKIGIGTPNIFRPANVARALLGNLNFPMVIGGNQEIGDYIHVQEFHESQIRLSLEEQGFISVSVECIFFGLSFLNLSLADLPDFNLGKTFCHFLFATGEKPSNSLI